MSKTKIRISPVKDYKVQFVLEVSEISKSELTEVVDSYLFEFKKISKSGNQLSFSMFFDKKYFNRSIVKEGNPYILVFSSNQLLTIKITSIIAESEIKDKGMRYSLEKESTGDITFSSKFDATYSYFQKNILLKREELFNEKRKLQHEEKGSEFYLMPTLRRYEGRKIGIATEASMRCCKNCMFLNDDFVCGRHQQKVHKQNVCSSYSRPKFVSGGLVSPK